jgi:glycosyltransferase involved in cell wall biosynthesis
MNLCTGLADDYPALLVTGTVEAGEADMLEEARARGIAVLTIPELGREIRPGRDMAVVRRLVEVLRRVRPELVDTHTAKAGTVGRLAARIAAVPRRLHTFHGHVFRGYFGAAKTGGFVRIERALASLTDRVIALSEAQRRDLVEQFRICAAERVRVIPLGLDLSPFASADPAAVRAFRASVGAERRPIVSIVGRLAPVKNHDLFLDAASLLSAGGRELVFAVVGGGSEEARLRARADALGVAHRVRFLGWRRDLPVIYHGSDAVVLTSHEEGTPVCLIEALAARRPVVATAVGGVPDVLRGVSTARLVPPGDAAAIAEAINAAIDAPPSPAGTAAGAARITRTYAMSRLLQESRALYDELAASKSRRRRVPLPFRSRRTRCAT